MFSSEEFLTVSQVAGSFSRLAAKKSLLNDDYLEEEIECATEEAIIEELTNEVSRELLPGHPVMWDKYNLCEMTSGGKLNTTKLSVAKLRDICCGLDLAVDVSIKRKQPYAEKLRSIVKNVTAKRISKAQSKLKGGVRGREEGNHRDTFISITTQIPRQALT